MKLKEIQERIKNASIHAINSDYFDKFCYNKELNSGVNVNLLDFRRMMGTEPYATDKYLEKYGFNKEDMKKKDFIELLQIKVRDKIINDILDK